MVVLWDFIPFSELYVKTPNAAIF